MTKRVGLLGAWLLATLALGFVGYGAVALVGNQVTDQPTGRVVNLSVTTTIPDVTPSREPIAPTPIAEPDEDLFTPSSVESSSDTTEVDDESVDSTTTSEAPAAAPPATSAPVTESPPPPPTTTTTSTVPPTTNTTMPIDDDGEIVETGPFTFTSAGGVVTVTCVVDKVRFGAASPSGGATVMVIDRGPQEVEVDFATSSTDWTTKVTCNDGVATAEFD